MSNTPIQVTTDLSKLLEQINTKLEMLQKEVIDFRTETKVAIESVKGDINTLKWEVNNLKDDVKDIKGSQKVQIWTLIGILSRLVVGTVIRFVITASPSKPWWNLVIFYYYIPVIFISVTVIYFDLFKNNCIQQLCIDNKNFSTSFIRDRIFHRRFQYYETFDNRENSLLTQIEMILCHIASLPIK